MYEVRESTRHECSANDKVEKYKKYTIGEKADLITKKNMEHKEILKENLEIESQQYKI